MASSSPNEQGDRSPERFAELLAEVTRLRARVAQLEAERAALLRAAVDRDYERPPHHL